VPVGEHYVVVRARGYRESVGTVMVTGKKRARLTLYPEQRGSVRKALAWDEQESSGSSGAGWAAIGVGATGELLYAERGDQTNSRQYLEQFLEHWGNADWDLPEVRDARARLSRPSSSP